MDKHIGSNFDDFLKEEKILNETEAIAIKRVLAYQIQQELKKKKISKAEIAKKMHTSRASLDRLLDPTNIGITLKSLVKLAHVLGKKIHFSFAA